MAILAAMKVPKPLKKKKLRTFTFHQDKPTREPGHMVATFKLIDTPKRTGSETQHLGFIGPRGGLVATHKAIGESGNRQYVAIKPRHVNIMKGNLSGPFRVSHVE